MGKAERSMNLSRKIDSALKYLSEKHQADFADEYGETGYRGLRGVILANWHNVPKGLADWLEAIGYELEWSDEWTVVYIQRLGEPVETDLGLAYDSYETVSLAYRIKPNSYDWQPQILLTPDGEYLTPHDAPREWIDLCQVHSPKDSLYAMLPGWITDAVLKEEGFELLRPELFESGWFPGQNDTPAKAIELAFQSNIVAAVIRRDDPSQFYTRWSCWVQKEVEHEEAQT